MVTSRGNKGIAREKEIMQGTIPGRRRRGRLRTAWINNISKWTKPTVEGSVRMTNDRDQRRKYVHGMTNPWMEDG